MITAQPKLGQAVWRHVGRNGRRLQAHVLGLQVVGADDRAVQFGLERLPVLVHAQTIEPGCQSIIRPIARLKFAAQTLRERHLVRGSPRLNLIEPVIGLRQDAGQPDDAHLAETQARPIAVGREMFVNQFGHAQLKQQRDKDRYIVNPFVDSRDIGAHSRVHPLIGFSGTFDTAGEFAHVAPTSCNSTLAKTGCRVLAVGKPASQLAKRTKLIAVATVRCCRCVFAIPM